MLDFWATWCGPCVKAMPIIDKVAEKYADQGVPVTAVCPAIVRTPLVEKYLEDNPALEAQLTALHPMGRVGTPEEVAEAVAWLASPRSAFTTGHALVLDGGRLIT